MSGLFLGTTVESVGMKLSPAETRVFAAHLFAWAVQQARLRSYIAKGWKGTNANVAQLVLFAMRNAA